MEYIIHFSEIIPPRLPNVTDVNVKYSIRFYILTENSLLSFVKYFISSLCQKMADSTAILCQSFSILIIDEFSDVQKAKLSEIFFRSLSCSKQDQFQNFANRSS